MADYPELYRHLAQEIIKQDGKLETDAATFVNQLIQRLRAEGWQIGPESEAELTAYLNSVQTGIKSGIIQALTVASAHSTLQSEDISRMAEAAFSQHWQDGNALSDRLWKFNRDTRASLADVLQKGIRQGASVNRVVMDMQRTIERANAGQLFKIVERQQEDWVKDLHAAAQTLIFNPKAKAQWEAAVDEVNDRIIMLRETGTRHAAERVLSQVKKAVEKGSEDLLDNAVRWWVYDKQLFHLKRIARTEMATAAHRAVIASTVEDEDIIGYQWRLSSTHPRPDICDYYASIDMGLGKGVWTKDAVPHHKAHPHCMCLLIPRVTPIKSRGNTNYREFIEHVTPEQRQQLLPKWAQHLHGLGIPLDNLVRPDGMGLISKASLAERAGSAVVTAAGIMGQAKASQNWGTRSFQAGRMTRRTIKEFKPFAHVPRVKKLLDAIQKGATVDGLELKFLKRKYVEGEDIISSKQLNKLFESVFADPAATLHQRRDENGRYVLHSESLQLTAIMEKNGQRVTVFRDDGKKLESVWLSLAELKQKIR